MPDPTAETAKKDDDLATLLGSLPVRFWKCLNSEHRRVEWDGDEARCPDCGLTRSDVQCHDAILTGVVERRVRRECAADRERLIAYLSQHHGITEEDLP